MSLLAAIFLALAVVAGQILHGGLLVPAFTIPAYALLVMAAVAAFLSLWRNAAPGSAVGMAAVALFTSYVAWRCLNAPDGYLGRIDLQLALGGALAFFVSAAGLRDNRSRLVFLGIIGTAALVQASIGFLQFAWGDLVAPFGWFSADLKEQYGDRFAGRAHGFFLNPNQLAWLTTWSALFSLSLAAWGRVTLLWRLLFIYFTLVFVAITVLSGSRGGMASLALGLTVFTLLSVAAIANGHRRGRFGLIVGAVSLLVLCVGAGYLVYSSNWMTQGRVDAVLTVTDPRAVLLENAWRQFQVAPLFGVGPGMFLYAARLYRTGGQDGDPVFVHDDWMQVLTDYGFVGFSLALFAAVILLGGGIQRLFAVVIRQSQGDDGPFSNSVAILAGAVSAIFAFCAHSFTDFNMHVPANTLLAGATLGLLTGTAGRFANPTVASRFGGALNRVFGSLALCAVAGLSGWLLWKNAFADDQSLRAQNLLHAGEVFSALAVADRGLRAEPSHLPLLLSRGRALYDYLSAVQAADKPVDPPLTPSRLRELFEGSADSFQRALKQQPQERSTEIDLARSLIELKRLPEAKRHSIEAIRLDPRHSYAYSAYADNLYDAGEVQRAIRILEIASVLPPWQIPADRLLEIREEMAEPADPPDDDSAELPPSDQ